MGTIKVENIRVFAYHGCLKEETKIGKELLARTFVSKEEESTMMYRHAEGYTEEEVKALAEYFAER